VEGCLSGCCDASKYVYTESDNSSVPLVKIYSPLEGENFMSIVDVTLEVLYFDISDGYVEIELDDEEKREGRREGEERKRIDREWTERMRGERGE
jgi:hypothetical protein